VRLGFAGFLLILSAACAAPGGPAAPLGPLPPQPPLTADPDEGVVDLLGALVRINTFNNPDRGFGGNELALVGWVRDYLAARGIDHVKIFETAPGRGCLVARLKGDGSREPFLVMAHVDTVDVEPGGWTFDPLGGEIRDGYLYGRGAIDDKGMAACAIAALVRARRLGVKLRGDVILLLTADEESGGDHGIRAMVRDHLNEIRAGCAVNEGGSIVVRDGQVQYVAVQCTEKTVHNVTLTATGTSGHSSRPHADSAIDKLARAVARLAEFQAPVKLNDVTTGYFRAQAQLSADRELAAHFERLGQGDASAAPAVARHPIYNAQLRSTVAATLLKAGIRTNVIPGKASANLNIRLLPGEELEPFLETLRDALGRPKDLTLAPVEPAAAREPQAPMSPAHGPAYEAIVRAAGAVHPGARVLPSMSAGATDSRDLRLAGIPCYGVLPFALEESDLQRMHGNDERVPVARLGQGVEFMYRLMMEMVGP
jgi:acetylornithine deacetylase/succinyl-diaminopimelate desuccinylase-like protein